MFSFGSEPYRISPRKGLRFLDFSTLNYAGKPVQVRGNGRSARGALGQRGGCPYYKPPLSNSLLATYRFDAAGNPRRFRRMVCKRRIRPRAQRDVRSIGIRPLAPFQFCGVLASFQNLRFRYIVLVPGKRCQTGEDIG